MREPVERRHDYHDVAEWRRLSSTERCKVCQDTAVKLQCLNDSRPSMPLAPDDRGPSLRAVGGAVVD